MHHRQLRQNMMNLIHQKGISDARVLEAMNHVPRHLFMDASYTPAQAYEDTAQQIGEGQTISQPYTVAYQTMLLNVQSGEKVLEVGTGSGYQSAILYEMGAKLFSIERQRKLHDQVELRLKQLGYGQIHLLFGDGTLGWPEEAPFRKILVTAAAGSIPELLLEQLETGGVMVVPVNGELQKMLRISKVSATEIEKEEFDYFKFVPLLPGTTD